MKRSPLTRSEPLAAREGRKTRKTAEKPLGAVPIAEAARIWRQAVLARSNGRSVVSGLPVEDLHHVVHRNQLMRDDRSDLIWHVLNGVGLTRREHERHTLAVERVPRSCLPAEVIAWVEAEGYGWLLDRQYP